MHFRVVGDLGTMSRAQFATFKAATMRVLNRKRAGTHLEYATVLQRPDGTVRVLVDWNDDDDVVGGGHERTDEAISRGVIAAKVDYDFRTHFEEL